VSSETEAWRALTEEGEALAKERRTVDAAAAYNAACIVQVFSQFVCLCLCVSVCVVCVSSPLAQITPVPQVLICERVCGSVFVCALFP
jgi:hypothetical protein